MPVPKIQYKLEILSLLWLRGPRNLSDLARVTNYNFVTVKQLLQELERKEFVRVYTRTYPSGVRRYTIEITQRGINLARTYEKLKRALEDTNSSSPCESCQGYWCDKCKESVKLITR